MILKLGFRKFEIIQQRNAFVLGRLQDFLGEGSWLETHQSWNTLLWEILFGTTRTSCSLGPCYSSVSKVAVGSINMLLVDCALGGCFILPRFCKNYWDEHILRSIWSKDSRPISVLNQYHWFIRTQDLPGHGIFSNFLHWQDVWMIPGGDFCLVSKLRMDSDDRSFLGRYGRSKVVNLRSRVFDG